MKLKNRYLSPLQLARLRKGLFQWELAKLSGCSQAMIHQSECGKRHPSAELRQRIAAALNENEKILFPGDTK